MNSPMDSGLGTLNINTSTFPLPNIPTIIYEWAAILPLAIYLANPEQIHELVGKACLSDHITTAPFPLLGVLSHIAQLLQEGPDFLDRVSAIGGLRHEVWDTNWGSVFPCINGSAHHIITKFAIRNSQTTRVPETVFAKSGAGTTSTTTGQADKDPAANTVPHPCPDPGFRRYQNLHIIRFNRTSFGPPNTARRFEETLNLIYEIVLCLFLSAAAAISLLFGLYGTAVCFIVGTIARLSCRLVDLQRNKLHLHDNEEGKMDGCMLTAIHQNASTWYLYIGDRGVIDGVLNKAMVSGVAPGFLQSTPHVFLYFIKLLSLLQLAAVTYVAVQKGWDSIALLAFILFSLVHDAIWSRESRLARVWLRKHRVKVEARTFIFSGRVSMLGAIQVLKRTEESSWMDSILQRNARRDALLSGLCAPEEKYMESLRGLDELDREGVQRNVELSKQAAALIQTEFTNV